jgi:hypothetical protein
LKLKEAKKSLWTSGEEKKKVKDIAGLIKLFFL